MLDASDREKTGQDTASSLISVIYRVRVRLSSARIEPLNSAQGGGSPTRAHTCRHAWPKRSRRVSLAQPCRPRLCQNPNKWRQSNTTGGRVRAAPCTFATEPNTSRWWRQQSWRHDRADQGEAAPTPSRLSSHPMPNKSAAFHVRTRSRPDHSETMIHSGCHVEGAAPAPSWHSSRGQAATTCPSLALLKSK